MRAPDHVHAELLNWARWCWQGPWPHPLPATHCASAESYYRSPPDWNPEDAPEAPIIRPNERNARLVQDVWERMPCAEKAVLKAEYPGRWTSGRMDGVQAAAARIGMSVSVYEAAFAAALRLVENTFEVRR